MLKRFESADDECPSMLVLMILAICLVMSPMTVNISFGQEPATVSVSGSPSSEVDGEGELSLVASSPAAQEKNRPQQLSVEPGSQPMLPVDAPAWVGAAPDFSEAYHRLHVAGQIAETEEEAAEVLDEALVAAVSDYIDTQVLDRPGASDAFKSKLTADFIWKNLIDVPEGYVARLNTAGVPLYQKWVTVSITSEQREIFRNWDREAIQRRRLAPIGLGMMGLLSCVSLFRLVLKVRSAV